MPMYYPDLQSVKTTAEMMSKLTKKKYLGIIPQTEKDLPAARKALGEYFRTVLNDKIQAAEIEYAATKETYDDCIWKALFGYSLSTTENPRRKKI